MPQGTSPSPERTIQDVLEAINTFATETQKRFNAIDDRFEKIDQRFDSIEKRLDAHDRRFDAMDSRFDAHEQQMGDMQTSIDHLVRTTEDIQSKQHSTQRAIEHI